MEPAQMGRDERMRPVAGRFKDRFQKGDDRTLAVRARNMNDRREASVRISERGKKAMHPPEGKVDALWMQRFETRKQAFTFLRVQGFVLC
jgi:hypothetical protein